MQREGENNMEKMSRMSKYKDLREGIKTDVVSDKPTTAYTAKEEPVRDADYYKRFLASEEAALGQSAQLKNPVDDDTLMESMTFDTINSQVDEELERALSRVRQESGQEDFNTRMDILNKIRQSKMVQEPDEEEEIPEEDDDADDLEDEEDEEEQTRRRFGFFKRHQDDEDDDEDEEDEADEDDDDEEDDDEPKRGFSLFKRHHDSDDEEDEEDDEEVSYDDDDEEEEENSTFVKILNGVIVVLALVLIALLGYIAKEYFL